MSLRAHPRFAVPSPASRLALFTVLAWGLTLGATQAEAAAWWRPRVEVGASQAWFTPLAEYLRFESIPGSGVPEERRMEYEDTTLLSARLAFDLHPELQFGWTRAWGSTRLRYFIDGEELRTGDENDGQPIVVPDFDLQIDLFTFRWSPEAVRWKGLGAVVELGGGRIAQEQKGEFGPDNTVRTFDWSDDDFALVFGLGVQGSWSRVNAGIGLEAVRWRFEAPLEDNRGIEVAEVIPDEVAVSYQLSGRVSYRF